MRQWVDCSRHSAVAGCGCGWRTLAADRQAAWSAAQAHARLMHRGEPSNAAVAARQARARTV